MGEDSKNDVSGSTFLKLNADDLTITMLEKLHGLHGSMNLFNSENKVNPIVDVFGIDAAHIGYLYSEYMPDGSVYSYIKSYNLSTHKSNIVLKLHFDISVKSSNILCASSYGGKIYAVVDEYTPDKNGNKSGRYTCNISVFDVKGNLLEKYSFPSQIESKFGTEENDYPYSLAVFGNYMMISMYSMGDMYVLKMSDSKLTLFACDDSGYYRRRLATENGNSFKKPLNDKYVLIGDADKLTVLDIEKGELVEVSFDCGGKSYDELGFTADENYNIIVTARNNIETNDNSKSNADYYYFTCDELLEALRNI